MKQRLLTAVVGLTVAATTANVAHATTVSTSTDGTTCKVPTQLCASFERAAAGLVSKITQSAGGLDPALAWVVPDYDNASFVVYRVGGGVSPVYTALAGGFPVSFADSTLSASQMQTGMETLWASRDKIRAAGIDLVGVAVTKTTVEVYVDLTSQRTTLAEPEVSRVIAGFSPLGAAGFKLMASGQQIATNRQTDRSPFHDGDDTISSSGLHVNGLPYGSECSSGFSGLSTSNGRRYNVTAEHCLKPGDPRLWVIGTGGQGTFMGTASVLDPNHDLAYVPVPDGQSTQPGSTA